MPESSLFLLCTKAHSVLAVAPRVISGDGVKAEPQFGVRWDGWRGGSDCWEFSLDNGGALDQQSIS